MDRIKLGSFAGEQVFMAVEGEAALDIKESAQHIPQQPQERHITNPLSNIEYIDGVPCRR